VIYLPPEMMAPACPGKIISLLENVFITKTFLQTVGQKGKISKEYFSSLTHTPSWGSCHTSNK